MIQILAGRFRRLAAELAAVGGFDDVVATVLREAGTLVGSDVVMLALPEPGGRRLRLSTNPREAARSLPEWDGVGIDASHPLVDALTAEQPVVLAGDPAASGPRRPLSGLGGLGMRAGVLYPLGTIRGPLGVIGFLWRRRRRFGRPELEALRVVADLSGLALERARLRMLEHELVSALRSEVLEAPGLLCGVVEVAGGYEPAWAGVPLGGDWFDVVETGSGRVAIAVGDVAGHGVRSAPEMIAARQILRGLLIDDLDPGVCLERLDERLGRHHGDTLVSVLVAAIDPAEATLTIANGGLPSPWVRPADGAAHRVAAGRGRVVGVGPEGGTRRSETIPFGPGSVLVAHSDGLQAGRPETPESLVDEIAGLLGDDGARSLDDLVNRLLRRDAGTRLRADDTVVLAARLLLPT